MNKNDFLDLVNMLEISDTMDYTGYYCGYSLLNMRDLNDEIPEIFICSGNRTAGKTFFFKRFMMRLCVETKKQFLVLVRKRTQLYTAAKSFVEDLQECKDMPGQYSVNNSDIVGVKEIFYGSYLVGYISYLNYADDIKEASNMFNNVCVIFKDEIQLPNGNYLENEIGKLRSIHKSCARGFGEKTRYLPTILCGNELSLINPYYVTFGIHKRLNKETKKMRGNGWVMQITWNESAAQLATKSAFEKAFGEDKQSLSDNFNVYMDNLNMVGVPVNKKYLKILFIMYVNKVPFGVWGGQGFYYVSRKVDLSCPRKYAMDLESHNEKTILIQRNDILFISLRKYFESGLFRFQDVECRSIMIDALANTVL